MIFSSSGGLKTRDICGEIFSSNNNIDLYNINIQPDCWWYSFSMGWHTQQVDGYLVKDRQNGPSGFMRATNRPVVRLTPLEMEIHLNTYNNLIPTL